MSFSRSVWQTGFVSDPPHIFLLVTLEKKDVGKGFQYEDRFLSQHEFQWQSQNRTTQAGKPGQELRHHQERGTEVHLFVRKEKKRGQRAAPFTYCGEVDFTDWSGEKPITIRWHLREAVPERLHDALRVGEGDQE